MSNEQPITDKPFTLTVKELIYIFTIVLSLGAQWYSQKSTISEAVLTFKSENALLRLEISVLKAQIEELKQTNKQK